MTQKFHHIVFIENVKKKIPQYWANELCKQVQRVAKYKLL